MRWLVGIALLGLAACAELPAPIPPATTESAQPVLGPPLLRFVADGRIALRSGERHDHLRFHWEHSPEHDSVLLLSPLGQGLAELTRDASGARLTQPHQPPRVASDLRLLAQDVLGTPLPLEALADWLRGAHPELQGAVDGWQVTVSETTPYRQRRLLRVLEARREQSELKLIVDEWEADE
ncbi:MAG: outer membrane lipoprotein LolB [Rhodocyclales bacterium]|nr:outer membrane lipoprotein LolB [Rhodocyclales bacterium]